MSETDVQIRLGITFNKLINLFIYLELCVVYLSTCSSDALVAYWLVRSLWQILGAVQSGLFVSIFSLFPNDLISTRNVNPSNTICLVTYIFVGQV